MGSRSKFQKQLRVGPYKQGKDWYLYAGADKHYWGWFIYAWGPKKWCQIGAVPSEMKEYKPNPLLFLLENGIPYDEVGFYYGRV